jgi:hypothetical protein
MRILILFLFAFAAAAQTYTVGAGGVSVHTLLQLDSNSLAVPLSTGAYLGIAQSTVAQGGIVNVLHSGVLPCVFENNTTPGDLVIPGTGTMQDCRDSGATAINGVAGGTRILGMVNEAVASGETAHVVLGALDVYGTSGVGGSGTFSIPITAPSINGIFTVDETVYTTLDEALAAAKVKANGAVVWVGPGNWILSSPFAEPEQTKGVSIVSLGGSYVTFITAGSDMTSMLSKGDTAQGQFNLSGITFLCNSGSTIHAQYGLNLVWFRGGLLNDVQVQNCGTEDIAIGGGADGHQTSLHAVNIQTNYDESIFTGPAGGSGPTPPDIGVHLYNNAYDSVYDNLTIRNAHLEGLKIDATAAGNVFNSLSTFGYASSGILPYAASYDFEDASGGNTWNNLSCDSNTVSCFHLSMTGTGANDVINGGRFIWPSGTSFPSTANFGTMDQAYSDFSLKNFYCTGLATNNLWTVASASVAVLTGLRNNIDNIIGCSSQTIQYDLGGPTAGQSRYRNLWLSGNVGLSGSVTANFQITAGATSYLNLATRSRIYSPSDGILQLVNNATTGFTGLQFGGATSSFPYLKVNGAALNVRLADDSADAPLTTLTTKVHAVSVASLPTCNVAAEGTFAAVNDAAASPVYNVIVANGGSVHIPVYCNGTNWTNH